MRLEEDMVLSQQCLVSEFAFIQHQQMLTNILENSQLDVAEQPWLGG